MKQKKKTDLAYIAAPLRPLAVPVGRLKDDPANARTHDERNIDAVAASRAPPAGIDVILSPPLLVNAAETCRLLGIGRSLFYALQSAGRLPAPVHLGRSVRWGREELKLWVAAGCPPRHAWETRRREGGRHED